MIRKYLHGWIRCASTPGVAEVEGIEEVVVVVDAVGGVTLAVVTSAIRAMAVGVAVVEAEDTVVVAEVMEAVVATEEVMEVEAVVILVERGSHGVAMDCLI